VYVALDQIQGHVRHLEDQYSYYQKKLRQVKIANESGDLSELIKPFGVTATTHIGEYFENSVQDLLDNGPRIPAPVPKVKIVQIKEKFAGLRIYYDGGDEFIAGITQMAEAVAAITCEKCGVPGKVRNLNGFLATLCDSCNEIAVKERNERR
jgi:hypothetical protein